MIIKNKAQITVFIIIALLIVFIIIGFFIIKNNQINNGNGINQNIMPVYDYVENCLKTTGFDAIDYTSKRGGY